MRNVHMIRLLWHGMILTQALLKKYLNKPNYLICLLLIFATIYFYFISLLLLVNYLFGANVYSDTLQSFNHTFNCSRRAYINKFEFNDLFDINYKCMQICVPTFIMKVINSSSK